MSAGAKRSLECVYDFPEPTIVSLRGETSDVVACEIWLNSHPEIGLR